MSPRMAPPLDARPFAPPPDPQLRDRVGIVAGWGRYPWAVAAGLQRRGYFVACAGIRDHADPAIAQQCHDFQEVGLTKLGRLLRYFQRLKVRRVTLAGKIHKTLLFQPGFLWKYPPDCLCVRTFFDHFVSGRRTRTDDDLLSAVVRAFTRRGIDVVPATDLLPELLMNLECLGDVRLTRAQQQDVEFGWRVAKELGRLDIGQTVAVKGQAVLALEAVEGTDQCVRRAGQLCPSGGFTVVKVAKPQQDMRFDVPTVGIGTLQTMWQAGARVLALEADRTVLIDREEVLRFATANRILVVAIRDGLVSGRVPAAA